MGNISIPEIARDFIINIFNIIILFIIVKLLVYKPVKKFLDNRKEKISATKLEAQNLLKEAELKSAEYEKSLEASKEKGDEIIKEAEKTANDNAERITENARATAKSILDKAREDIKSEKEEMLQSMQDKITELAFGISSKILNREITDADNRAIAEEFFSKMQGNDL